MKIYKKYSIPVETQKEIELNFDTKKERKQFVKENFTPNLTTFEINMLNLLENQVVNMCSKLIKNKVL